MVSKASTVEEYLEELPEDRKAAITRLRKVIKKNLPKGFKEEMSYGMIGYVVPHSLYPAGYHCNTKLPLPFINLASQKNFISFYHMGIYADKQLKAWYQDEYAKLFPVKTDIGKACTRFKKPELIPYDLIGELVAKITVPQWIALYESAFKKKS